MPHKRRRRSKAEMGALRDAIVSILSSMQPMTVRQIFYQMVTRHLIAKSQAEYNNVVVRLVGQLREGGVVPWSWVVDFTRLMRKPHTWSNLEEALRRTAELYRRSLWDDQAVYVEVWVEKNALGGLLYEVTEAWDVPLMATVGFSSKTFLHSAAKAIEAHGKPAYIAYFGDHDPHGKIIDSQIEKGLRRYAPEAEIHFQRLAVTEQQIADWDLPTRPTKKTTAVGRKFRGPSVELDAISPDRLRELVRDCIEQHVDDSTLAALRAAEQSERELLMRIAMEASNGSR